MLDCLGLGAVYVCRNEEKGSVHDGCAGEHGREEDLVARAIAEGDVALEDKSGFAVLVVALGVVFFVGGVGLVAIGGGTGRAFEDLGVGVPQPDSDVPDPFLPKLDSVDSRKCSHDCRFTMRYMTNSANIECGLPAHDLWCVRGEVRDVFVVLRFEFFCLCVQLFDLLFGESGDVLHQC
jgi:hypothetical protein